MKTYYLHSTTKSGHRFTLAARNNEDNVIFIGIAVCSKKDKFCKKVGRNIAEIRLNTRKLEKAYERGYVDTVKLNGDIASSLRNFAEQYAKKH